MPRKARSHRLRFGRVSEHGRVYLVTAVCADRQAWFSRFEHGRCCVHAIRELEGEANTLCFVVMPDHMHWLMQLEAGDLSRVVQKVKGSTTRRIGQLRGRPCKVWQPGFHDRALRREEDLQAVARYVVANPLRAGLVSNLRHYPLWDAIWL
ncbi:REP-associated tyrosine transposase [Thioalkalivibrio thiocyanoxidans]|uniref:REP-associated tyrosine transposase n=1 Tax=Thioalkalivibrio thiocyanoxidans TaxID=152475 RepID=UPI000366DBAD|nr:transposase [Thioalkalivibrio thiocyanoxidans]